MTFAARCKATHLELQLPTVDKLNVHVLLQYMAGGDLGSALSLDVEESDDGARRRLCWYDMGSEILLRIISGLVDIHDLQVHTAPHVN